MGRTIPIIKLYDTLIVSIQIHLSDAVVLELKDEVGIEIARHDDVSGLVLEVSGVDVFDSFIARAVRDIAKLGALMGVRTVLAGLDAGMAVTLVEMGLHIEGVETAMNLEQAIEILAEHRAKTQAATAARW